MKIKEESEKAGLNLNIQDTKIMTSSSITSWQTDGEKVEKVSDFICVKEDSNCSQEIKRRLLLGRIATANLDNVLKSKDITLLTNVHIVRAMEKAMAPYSSTLAWEIPWMEEPGRLQSMGSLRVGHN